MSEREQRVVVTVEIAGEEYTLRAHASPDYTRECAAYLDGTISEILRQSSMIEAHKSVMLAALSLTDQLFQARAEVDALREIMARSARRLTTEISAVTAAAGPDNPDPSTVP